MLCYAMAAMPYFAYGNNHNTGTTNMGTTTI
jgi:hypothetical protein